MPHFPDQPTKYTLLVVDDEAILRKLAVRILASDDYTILEAPSGEDALSLMENHSGNLDLLITDMKMPGMNGEEVAEKICQSRPQTRVLYISGFSEFSLDGKTEIDFLAKPFTPADLLQAVHRILGVQTVQP